MSIHRYTSRGRTRQPKNLAMQHHSGDSYAVSYTHFAESGSVTIVDQLSSLSGNLDSTSAGANGYDTENQRYLHLCLETTGSSTTTVTVCAYNRQFGKWGTLRLLSGKRGHDFEASLVDVSFSGSASSTDYFVIPIEGVDRVAFVGSNSDRIILHVAGSTF